MMSGFNTEMIEGSRMGTPEPGKKRPHFEGALSTVKEIKLDFIQLVQQIIYFL